MKIFRCCSFFLVDIMIKFGDRRLKKICCAIFPHLQPMAELRRNQRGEIGRQHVKAHSCSHFSPYFDHTLPTQTDDGTSQIEHDIGAYVPYSFRTMSRVLLRNLPTDVQGWRRQGHRLHVTAGLFSYQVLLQKQH